MNVHTNNAQVIRQGGRSAFAVISHEVVGMLIENDWDLVKV